MDTFSFLEDSLRLSLDRFTQGSPKRLRDALFYAVFPGGGRVRPRLTLATALACSGEITPLARSCAVAVELLHCASLVHDDLPCFDDAKLRRSKPCLHRVYGEDIAVLVGDALIVCAFQTVAEIPNQPPRQLARIVTDLARALGPTEGLIAGQAWENVPHVDISFVHTMKTSALFESATALGAIASNRPEDPWRLIGRKIGRAYQLADDLFDQCGCFQPDKDLFQDTRNKKPNAVSVLGAATALRALEQCIDDAVALVPEDAEPAVLGELVRATAMRLVPGHLKQHGLDPSFPKDTPPAKSAVRA